MSFTRPLGRRGRAGASLPSRSAARRSRARRRVRLTPRVRLALVLAVLLAGLLLGAWMWLRDSSLVAVDQVTITGESGSDASAIRSALRSAARNMTTLDVRMDQLRTAVAPFPEVRRLSVRTAFPHGMAIDVIEQRPLAMVNVGGQQVAVAADGTILRAVAVVSPLPTIALGVVPTGRHLSGGRAAQAIALLAAAPDRLLTKISQVTRVAGHGLVVQIRNGPSIYFGDATRLNAKWVAAVEVLGDAASAGASYVDVTDPARPAAGAGPGTGGAAAGPGSSTAAAGAGPGSGAAGSGTSAVASGSGAAAAGSGAAASGTGAAASGTGVSGTPSAAPGAGGPATGTGG